VRQLRLHRQPTITLEMEHVEDMIASLPYFDLPTSTRELQTVMAGGV
jgi:hypothetical protein